MSNVFRSCFLHLKKYLCVCMMCLDVCRGLKRMLDTQELELEVCELSSMDARN